MNGDFIFELLLSHGPNGKSEVRPLAEWMRHVRLKDGFKEWLFNAGASIPTKFAEGLERLPPLGVCMTATSIGSDWAQSESGTFQLQGNDTLRYPLNKERRFIHRRLYDAPCDICIPSRPMAKDAACREVEKRIEAWERNGVKKIDLGGDYHEQKPKLTEPPKSLSQFTQLQPQTPNPEEI